MNRARPLSRNASRRSWTAACAISCLLHGGLLAWSATVLWSPATLRERPDEFVFELRVRAAPIGDEPAEPGPPAELGLSAPEAPIELLQAPQSQAVPQATEPEVSAADAPVESTPAEPSPEPEVSTVEPAPMDAQPVVLLPEVLAAVAPPVEESPSATPALDRASPTDETSAGPASAKDARSAAESGASSGEAKTANAAGDGAGVPVAEARAVPAHSSGPASGTIAVVAASAPAPVTRGAIAIETPRPAYPYESELHGEHGEVLCLLRIGADGKVTDVEVLSSCGFKRLDRAAIDSLKRWRFQPALEAGKPIASTLRHKVTFVFE